jgi:hypothetical protein
MVNLGLRFERLFALRNGAGGNDCLGYRLHTQASIHRRSLYPREGFGL